MYFKKKKNYTDIEKHSRKRINKQKIKHLSLYVLI